MRRKTIAISADVRRDNAKAIAHRVAQSFAASGYQIALFPRHEDVAAIGTGGSIEDARLVITIGGDGTLLRAARIADEYGLPILGINTGRLGFLTELDEGDPRIDALPSVLDGGTQIEERAALRAYYQDKTFFALNDVVVRKGGVSRLVPFSLRVNDDPAAQIPADGICIATPTGSTAYFLSAGGAIISPDVDAFGIVPLLPHTLFSRPLIVATSTRIEIGCDSEMAQAQLECDGDILSDIVPGTSVIVSKHPNPVRFVRLGRFRFFERLEEKMRWGVSIKERLR